MQQYVINFVSDLRQVCRFLFVSRFPPPLKLTATMKLKYDIKHHNSNTRLFSSHFQSIILKVQFLIIKNYFSYELAI
jgi:hypothetical protein